MSDWDLVHWLDGRIDIAERKGRGQLVAYYIAMRDLAVSELRRGLDLLPAFRNELIYGGGRFVRTREVPVPIQWFRIAEDEYNGADEGELWWNGDERTDEEGNPVDGPLPSERFYGPRNPEAEAATEDEERGARYEI